MDVGELAQEICKRMAAINRHIGKKTLREFWKGESYVLTYLQERGGASPSEMSEALMITTARIAVTLNTLEKKGLILRERSRTDRRRIWVTLTCKGMRHVSEQQARLLGEMEKLLLVLGREDAETYLRIMDKIAGIMDNQNIGEG